MSRGQIIISYQHPCRRFNRQETIRTLRRVIEGESRTLYRISVVYVNDQYMKKLNRHYLSHDYTTDVLCFPLESGRELEAELYVNLDRARIQADRYRVSYAEETRRLLVHGALHLLGYRDATKNERAKMKARENRYLHKNGKRRLLKNG